MKPGQKITGDGVIKRVSAPVMIAKIELTTEQKHHIAHAIDQLESNANLSSAEEIALNVLKSYPTRKITYTNSITS